MCNLLKIKTAFVGAAVAATMLQAAGAQSASNTQLSRPALRETVSVADIAGILAQYKIEGGLLPNSEEGMTTLAAQSAGGGVVFVTFLNCEDPAAGTGCASAVVFTAATNAGLAYDDINAFNVNSEVARATNFADQKMVVFDRTMIFNGGVSLTNIEYVMASFLLDVQRFFDAREAAGLPVSMKIRKAPGGKLQNFGAEADGDTAALKQPVRYILDDALSAAVANSWNVDFISVDDGKAN